MWHARWLSVPRGVEQGTGAGSQQVRACRGHRAVLRRSSGAVSWGSDSRPPGERDPGQRKRPEREREGPREEPRRGSRGWLGARGGRAGGGGPRGVQCARRDGGVSEDRCLMEEGRVEAHSTERLIGRTIRSSGQQVAVWTMGSRGGGEM